jgi:hypothetical protein
MTPLLRTRHRCDALRATQIRKTATGYEFAKAVFPTVDAVVKKLTSQPFSSARGTPLSLKLAVARSQVQPVPNLSQGHQQPPSLADRMLLVQRAEADRVKTAGTAGGGGGGGGGAPAAEPVKRPTEEERMRFVQMAQQAKSKGAAIAPRSTAAPPSAAAAAVGVKPAPTDPPPSAATLAAAGSAPGPMPPGAVRVKVTRTAEHGMGIRIGEATAAGAVGCVVKMILNPALEAQLVVGQRLLAIGSLDVSSMQPRVISAIIRGMQSAVFVLQAEPKMTPAAAAVGGGGGGAAAARRGNGANRSKKLQLHIAPLDVESFEKLDINRTALEQVPVEARSRTVNRFLDILPNPGTAVQLSELPMDRTSRCVLVLCPPPPRSTHTHTRARARTHTHTLIPHHLLQCIASEFRSHIRPPLPTPTPLHAVAATAAT